MSDPVNSPSHYTQGKIETIDFIEDKGLNYHRGNAVKYITRAGLKDPSKEIEDLQKAIWYLQREIGRLKDGDATDCMTNTVQRKVILDFVEALGFDPADVSSLTIVDSEVTLTVLDKVGGHKVIDPATNEFRKSAVVLHVLD